MPGYPSQYCCTTPCDPCTGSVPTTVTLSISDIFDDLCTGCGDLDADYVLDYGYGYEFLFGEEVCECCWGGEFEYSGGIMHYHFPPDDPVCWPGEKVFVTVRWKEYSSGKWRLDVQLVIKKEPPNIAVRKFSGNTGRLTGGDLDCCSWSALTSGLGWDNTGCDASTATVEITSGAC